jgi:hypothetical protein
MGRYKNSNNSVCKEAIQFKEKPLKDKPLNKRI